VKFAETFPTNSIGLFSELDIPHHLDNCFPPGALGYSEDPTDGFEQPLSLGGTLKRAKTKHHSSIPSLPQNKFLEQAESISRELTSFGSLVENHYTNLNGFIVQERAQQKDADVVATGSEGHDTFHKNNDADVLHKHHHHRLHCHLPLDHQYYHVSKRFSTAKTAH
jgi:hypothetical protein